MGRPLRIDTPGTWHHVMNRGAGRRTVFRDDGERRFFVGLIAEVEERFELEVHAYCLMSNHYHLLVRSRAGRISDAMAWLGAHFTRSANATRGVDGAIFRGRFHSVLVAGDSHLDWLFRYINANPSDLGWEGPFAAYPWSGLATALGRRNEPWLRTDYVRTRFGEDACAIEAFVESGRVHAPVPERLGASYDHIARAVELARGPGPDVHSNAEVRAATTWLAMRSGLAHMDVETIAALSVGAAQRYLDRVRQRIDADCSMRQFVARAASVVALDTGVSSIGA